MGALPLVLVAGVLSLPVYVSVFVLLCATEARDRLKQQLQEHTDASCGMRMIADVIACV